MSQFADLFGGLPVVLLNLRANHAAAVTEPGELWVWGQNTCGKLGLGDDSLQVIPTLVEAGGILAWGGSHVYMVVCGYNHQLVLSFPRKNFELKEKFGTKLFR